MSPQSGGAAVASDASALAPYAGLVPEDLLTTIEAAGRHLAGLRVLHLNTTWRGGGVAGLIEQLVPIARRLGLPHDRHVIELDEPSSRFFAAMTDLLQGGGSGAPPEEGRRAFLDHLSRVAASLTLPEADVYIVHDPQLAPLASLVPTMRRAAWFSHLDTAAPNPAARDLVVGWLDGYARVLFTTPDSVFPTLSADRVRVVRLGIDPFAPKNRPQPPGRRIEILRRHGIDPDRPLIAQISRFGIWKNPWQAVEIFRLCKAEAPGLQLALVGALEASDDADAAHLRDEIAKVVAEDPDIHILSDPAVVDAACVDTIQRQSEVVLQRSRREGFGFTVTEAMWKARPVVATNANGIRFQVRDGVDGILRDDAAAAAAATAMLLRDHDRAAALGASARERVRQRHLLPAFLADYLAVLGDLAS